MEKMLAHRYFNNLLAVSERFEANNALVDFQPIKIVRRAQFSLELLVLQIFDYF